MKRRDGFTLIEIMAVVGIVALLAGLLLGGLNAAKGKAKKTLARTEIDQIVTAWNGYFHDYRHFPDVGPGNSYEITEMGMDAIRILQGNYGGAWRTKNPRKTAYLGFHAATTDESGYQGYLDPWGNVYQVRLDEERYDGEVIVPVDGSIQFSVAVWSMGPDGVDATPDDIRSWDKR